MKYRFGNLSASILVFLWLLAPAKGQDLVVLEPDDNGARVFSAGYFGNNAWNPGLSGAISKSLNAPGEQQLNRFFTQWSAEVRGGFYIDPGSHAALFLNGGAGFSGHWLSGWNAGIDLLPVGLYRSILPETYEFDGEMFQQVALPGNLYFAPSAGISVGKSTGHALVSGWYSRISVMLLAPYNFYVMPLISLEAGITLHRKGGGP